MSNEILKIEKLEHLLQTNWAEFLDHIQVMRIVMEHVRDTDFKVINQKDIPPRHIKITVTKFEMIKEYEPFHCTCTSYRFNVWVEYSVPKGEGVVIGTNTYILDLSGGFHLKESFGTHFLPENS